ncbi:carbon-nitrogen hydrolase family protein [Kordiimonas pumila]|uniref:Carbon-nitrogen hydrolase family protein n=1 Tax=Kordiimonas pumila TaxID=2161677 RepID=A0ABV7D7P9_9PROT|nr:carbon-nitrogen hydrolase family protein [Kordiimonas pumila]
MSATLNVACVQNCATDNLTANLKEIDLLIAEAVSKGAEFIALPEACEFLSGDKEAMKAHAKPASEHRAFQHLVTKAKHHGVWLLIGSLTMRDCNNNMVNRSSVVGPAGQLVATYDKIHMFDANVDGVRGSNESALYKPGEKACLAALPWGFLGMSICYDVRFPYLYRSLAKAGATLLSVPAAFMQATGEAGHWNTLLRARAIETGCFVIAPAQYGNPYGARQSYGHSLIIAPWGEILAEAVTEAGVITATLDLEAVAAARSRIMSLNHDRDFEAPAIGRPATPQASR